MAEQLLDRSNVVPILQKMRRKRVPEAVTGRPVRQACSNDGLTEGPLNRGFVEVMPAALAGWGVNVVSGGWKTHCQGHSRPAFALPPQGVRELPPNRRRREGRRREAV
jgi:hypothetical protein